eukprot:SAG31_NODE_3900_length_3771_cov_17.031863_2_plen_199_part_00
MLNTWSGHIRPQQLPAAPLPMGVTAHWLWLALVQWSQSPPVTTKTNGELSQGRRRPVPCSLQMGRHLQTSHHTKQIDRRPKKNFHSIHLFSIEITSFYILSTWQSSSRPRCQLCECGTANRVHWCKNSSSRVTLIIVKCSHFAPRTLLQWLFEATGSGIALGGLGVVTFCVNVPLITIGGTSRLVTPALCRSPQLLQI